VFAPIRAEDGPTPMLGPPCTQGPWVHLLWVQMSHAPGGGYGTFWDIWDIFCRKLAMSGHLCPSDFGELGRAVFIRG
jgi:hypothetical protein